MAPTFERQTRSKANSRDATESVDLRYRVSSTGAPGQSSNHQLDTVSDALSAARMFAGDHDHSAGVRTPRHSGVRLHDSPLAPHVSPPPAPEEAAFLRLWSGMAQGFRSQAPASRGAAAAASRRLAALRGSIELQRLDARPRPDAGAYQWAPRASLRAFSRHQAPTSAGPPLHAPLENPGRSIQK